MHLSHFLPSPTALYIPKHYRHDRRLLSFPPFPPTQNMQMSNTIKPVFASGCIIFSFSFLSFVYYPVVTRSSFLFSALVRSGVLLHVLCSFRSYHVYLTYSLVFILITFALSIEPRI
ncbi:hypothetical protein BDV98DRAFT_556593 [Pterulicium gracile]|uniref:Uncharacterized protein n=1 Tax=Pterulicium gracile TaxID=1884261 RepID=A0A5C3PZE5_9AGAR|nr:hypothetical protein BDV98DRAFT_556593 [Pterula gracilis]